MVLAPNIQLHCCLHAWAPLRRRRQWRWLYGGHAWEVGNGWCFVGWWRDREEEAKAGWNGSATPEGGDDDNNDNHDSCEEGEDTYKTPARSDIINIIIPAVARKKKNKPATMPDLRQRNHRAGQAGGLAGVSKLWTSLGRHPAWSAIWKALATD